MRGDESGQTGVFSYVQPEERIPADHPLRAVRRLLNEALKGMTDVFDRMYARSGRPSIPPKQLLRALLLQVLYSVRSERLLMEQLDYNLLFRWFVGLSTDDTVWHPTTFTKNRDRLLNSEVATEFFQRVRDQAQRAGLLSDEHFTVDGTLIEAWASLHSFRPRDHQDGDRGSDDSGRADFRGQTLASGIGTGKSTKITAVRLAGDEECHRRIRLLLRLTVAETSTIAAVTVRK